jgi:hypothetical protein
VCASKPSFAHPNIISIFINLHGNQISGGQQRRAFISQKAVAGKLEVRSANLFV